MYNKSAFTGFPPEIFLEYGIFNKRPKGLALSWHNLNWIWGIIGNLTQMNLDLCELEK
jgi:hypothetical protein